MVHARPTQPSGLVKRNLSPASYQMYASQTVILQRRYVVDMEVLLSSLEVLLGSGGCVRPLIIARLFDQATTLSDVCLSVTAGSVLVWDVWRAAESIAASWSIEKGGWLFMVHSRPTRPNGLLKRNLSPESSQMCPVNVYALFRLTPGCLCLVKSLGDTVSLALPRMRGRQKESSLAVAVREEQQGNLADNQLGDFHPSG